MAVGPTPPKSWISGGHVPPKGPDGSGMFTSERIRRKKLQAWAVTFRRVSTVTYLFMRLPSPVPSRKCHLQSCGFLTNYSLTLNTTPLSPSFLLLRSALAPGPDQWKVLPSTNPQSLAASGSLTSLQIHYSVTNDS